MLAVSLCLGVPGLLAQSTAPPSSPPSGQAPKQTSGQGDNPFPGDAPQAPAPSAPAAGQSAPSSTGQTPSQAPGQSGDGKPDAKGKRESDNPFPGEDPNAPIIPVAPGPGAGPGQGADSGSAARPGRTDSDAAGVPRRDADPDGDPVRSPDGDARTANDDGFSSSREGVRQAPVDEDADAKPGKSAKNKNRAQTIKEDLDVGGFYLDKKNWKAAQGRFSSAFALDAENPDTVWGLAEAERHMQLYKEAAEHYKLFLSYEPDGKRGREARKALEEVQAAQPSASVK